MNQRSPNADSTGLMPISRRAVLLGGMGTAAGVLLRGLWSGPLVQAAAARAAAASGSFDAFLRHVAAPPQSLGPRFRWWWGEPYDAATIVHEVKGVHEAGFRALEIAYINTAAGLIGSGATGVGALSG